MNVMQMWLADMRRRARAKAARSVSIPDGVSFTNQGALIAVRDGTVVAEATGPSHFSIYDWTPSDDGVMDAFMARLAELEAAEGEGT